MQNLAPFLAVLAAYLLGSLAFAVIVSRVMGLSDPRTFGSKNPGATNVLRSGSKAAAIVTLLFDALNGFAYSQVGAIAVVIVVAVSLIDLLSQAMRSRLL